MRVLMCPPDHFDVSYEINPWMRLSERPAPTLARAQWDALHRILRDEVSAAVELIEARPGLPDMVFTANAGITRGARFVPSRFRYPERQGETPHFVRWFAEHGYAVDPLPATAPGSFEGEGDALFYGDALLTGHGHRSDASVTDALSALVDAKIVPLRLVDPRWYHLDTCLIPLRPDLLAYYPPAFAPEAQATLASLPGEKLHLTEADALRFGGNAVVIGEHVVMNAGCDALAAELQRRGFRVHPTDTSEFLKAGGSAKCLTLLLEH